MSARATVTSEEEVDRAARLLRDRADEFARLAPSAKAALARQALSRLPGLAADWVAAGAEAKGLTGNLVAEEWLAGPLPTARMLRLAAETWDSIQQSGRPPFGTASRTRDDGRVVVDVFPTNAFERIMYRGFSCHVVMEPGVTLAGARERQASFYSQFRPEGGVSLILGAGNVSSIPAVDVVSKWLEQGRVCLLKMSPVNAWVGPFLEEAFAPFVEPGYLRIVYGGGDVGEMLVNHPLVDDVHITGSDETHDLIVWGPPGPERDRRKREGDPVLTKPITSELGNVSPVAIVPADYSERQLAFQARNAATMVAQNGSFNCNAVKMLVTSESWPQREQFFDLLSAALANIPLHTAYYPGAFDRYERLVGDRSGVETIGQADADCLAWTVVRDLDPADPHEDLFRTEPFCGIVSEAPLAPADPADFLEAATEFMNDRLWGTLNAMIVIPPDTQREIPEAVDRSIDALRYGTVAVNQWPAVGFALMTAPWGGHPSASLADVQSGLGWIHNTFLLEGVEKSVLTGPIVAMPDPPWFVDNPRALAVSRRAALFETDPGWLRLGGVVGATVTGR